MQRESDRLSISSVTGRLRSTCFPKSRIDSANRLTLFVDGERVAQTPLFDAKSYLVDANQPLRLGTGTNGPLNGALADVRIFRRTLNLTEIQALAKLNPKE